MKLKFGCERFESLAVLEKRIINVLVTKSVRTPNFLISALEFSHFTFSS